LRQQPAGATARRRRTTHLEELWDSSLDGEFRVLLDQVLENESHCIVRFLHEKAFHDRDEQAVDALLVQIILHRAC
jgi:hypothetical protein